MRKPSRSADLVSFLLLALDQQRLLFSAAQTIWSRSALAMTGALTPLEATRMWTEKQAAFAEGFEKAAKASMRGKSVAHILTDALAPIVAKTTANAKRLRR